MGLNRGWNLRDLDIPDYYAGIANVSFRATNVLAEGICLVQAYKHGKMLVSVSRRSSRSIRGTLVAVAGRWSCWIF